MYHTAGYQQLDGFLPSLRRCIKHVCFVYFETVIMFSLQLLFPVWVAAFWWIARMPGCLNTKAGNRRLSGRWGYTLCFDCPFILGPVPSSTPSWGEPSSRSIQIPNKPINSSVQALGTNVNVLFSKTIFETKDSLKIPLLLFLGMIGSGKSDIRTVVSIAQSQVEDGPVPPAIEAFVHGITLEVYYTTLKIQAKVSKTLSCF